MHPIRVGVHERSTWDVVRPFRGRNDANCWNVDYPLVVAVAGEGPRLCDQHQDGGRAARDPGRDTAGLRAAAAGAMPCWY